MCAAIVTGLTCVGLGLGAASPVHARTSGEQIVKPRQSTVTLGQPHQYVSCWQKDPLSVSGNYTFTLSASVNGGNYFEVGALYPPATAAAGSLGCSDPAYPYPSSVTFVPSQVGTWSFRWCYVMYGDRLACYPGHSITVIQMTLPGVVNDLRAQASTSWRGKLRVTWSAPSVTGGDSELSYQYRVGRGPWRETSTPGPLLVSGARGKSLVIFVRAVNSMGAGQATSVSGVPR